MSVSGPCERQALDSDSPWWTIHVARYRFAADFARVPRVLDIACGTGYGLSRLKAFAGSVVGVDIDFETAKTARSQSQDVVIGDGTALPFEDDAFDLVVSFETLEHLHERGGFLAQLRRVLTPGGVLILSTPNANHSRPVNGKPRNPYHAHEYHPEELASELAHHFSSVELLTQSLDLRFHISPFWDDQQELAASGLKGQVLLWRLLYRLPRSVADRVSRLVWNHPLLPGVEDYCFEPRSLGTAPVLVAICRKTR